jgi:hypothetical protein
MKDKLLLWPLLFDGTVKTNTDDSHDGHGDGYEDYGDGGGDGWGYGWVPGSTKPLYGFSHATSRHDGGAGEDGEGYGYGRGRDYGGAGQK